MKVFVWDEVSHDITEWDVPDELITDDDELSARRADEHISKQICSEYPDPMVSASLTSSGVVVGYEGYFNGGRHRCGLYFSRTNQNAARAACEQALIEYEGVEDEEETEQDENDRKADIG
jgi:hypothetical protein